MRRERTEEQRALPKSQLTTRGLPLPPESSTFFGDGARLIFETSFRAWDARRRGQMEIKTTTSYANRYTQTARFAKQLSRRLFILFDRFECLCSHFSRPSDLLFVRSFCSRCSWSLVRPLCFLLPGLFFLLRGWSGWLHWAGGASAALGVGVPARVGRTSQPAASPRSTRKAMGSYVLGRHPPLSSGSNTELLSHSHSSELHLQGESLRLRLPPLHHHRHGCR